MSFLNPVNEPVLMFSSTDASAPQINYNSRAAGDIKAVLKACLVTGYGPKASAGWSIVNEVGNVAEFVSPSAAMSDYKFGIDDTSSTQPVWYYTYRDIKTTPSPANGRPKTTSYIDNNSSNNGWVLLVTARGFYFISVMQSSLVNKLVSRVLYLGNIKSALTGDSINIGFWIAGHDGYQYPAQTIGSPNIESSRHYRLGSNVGLGVNLINSTAVYTELKSYSDVVTVDTLSPMWLTANNMMVGLQPGVLVRDVNNTTDTLGVYQNVVDGRPALYVGLGFKISTLPSLLERCRHIVIHLDYWEY